MLEMFSSRLYNSDNRHRPKMQEKKKNQCTAFELQNRPVKLIGSDNRVIKYF